MTDSYHLPREPSIKAKINTVLKTSGFAKGWVRGVWCEKCQRYRFHNFVYCIGCLGGNELTKLLSGCQTQSCLACSKNTELTLKEKLERVKDRKCYNTAKTSQHEVHTLLPPDLFSSLLRVGKIQRIKPTRRTNIWLCLQYALKNKKFFPMNGLNFGYCFKHLNEMECAQVIVDTHRGIPFPEEVRGFANEGIDQCSKPESMERSLFDMGDYYVVFSYTEGKKNRAVMNGAFDLLTSHTKEVFSISEERRNESIRTANLLSSMLNAPDLSDDSGGEEEVADGKNSVTSICADSLRFISTSSSLFIIISSESSIDSVKQLLPVEEASVSPSNDNGKDDNEPLGIAIMRFVLYRRGV